MPGDDGLPRALDGVPPTASGRGRRWKGPTEPMTPDQQKLAAQWIDMAYGQAQLWSRTRPLLRDEFVSAAMFALVEAARNFLPSLGKTFYTYLVWHLRHARKEVLRQSTPKGYRITGCLRRNSESLRRRRPVLVEIDPRRDYRLADDHVAFADYETREWLQAVLGKLSPEHVGVIIQTYWDGRYPQEIADEWGWSRDAVVTLLEEALAALRTSLGAPLLPPEPEPVVAEPSSVLGPLIRAVRTARGETTAAVAARAGLEADTLGQIERQQVRPGAAVLRRLAAALEKDPELFLSLSGRHTGAAT